MTAGRTSITLTKSWNTPPNILASVRETFGGRIDLDPCSNDFSMTDAQVSYSLPNQDGLAESWEYPTIFVNPPYGKDSVRGTRIADWFARISEAALSGSKVIALVPVATNTHHWKKFFILLQQQFASFTNHE